MENPEIMAFKINDTRMMNASYMPFTKQLCLFILTDKKYEIGTPIEVELTLDGDAQSFKVVGEVMWVNFDNDIYAHKKGLGIKVTNQNIQEITQKIEKLLDQSKPLGAYTM